MTGEKTTKCENCKAEISRDEALLEWSVLGGRGYVMGRVKITCDNEDCPTWHGDIFDFNVEGYEGDWRFEHSNQNLKWVDHYNHHGFGYDKGIIFQFVNKGHLDPQGTQPPFGGWHKVLGQLGDLGIPFEKEIFLLEVEEGATYSHAGLPPNTVLHPDVKGEDLSDSTFETAPDGNSIRIIAPK